MMYLVRPYVDLMSVNDKGRFDRIMMGYRKEDKRYTKSHVCERKGLIYEGKWVDYIKASSFVIECDDDLIEKIKCVFLDFGIPYKIYKIDLIFEWEKVDG